MTLESSRIYVILCKADQHVVVSVILCFLISKTALIIRKQNKERIVASRWVIILTLSSRNNHFTQIKNRYFHASILNVTVQPRLCKRNQGSDAIQLLILQKSDFQLGPQLISSKPRHFCLVKILNLFILFISSSRNSLCITKINQC